MQRSARYYLQSAQDWERQALIRSRAAAGSAELFARFEAAVTPTVFRPDVSVTERWQVFVWRNRRSTGRSEKKSGFNVKLGRGGIREIEFIAQALQLAHGGATIGCACRTR